MHRMYSSSLEEIPETILKHSFKKWFNISTPEGTEADTVWENTDDDEWVSVIQWSCYLKVTKFRKAQSKILN